MRILRGGFHLRFIIDYLLLVEIATGKKRAEVAESEARVRDVRNHTGDT